MAEIFSLDKIRSDRGKGDVVLITTLIARSRESKERIRQAMITSLGHLEGIASFIELVTQPSLPMAQALLLLANYRQLIFDQLIARGEVDFIKLAWQIQLDPNLALSEEVYLQACQMAIDVCYGENSVSLPLGEMRTTILKNPFEKTPLVWRLGKIWDTIQMNFWASLYFLVPKGQRIA